MLVEEAPVPDKGLPCGHPLSAVVQADEGTAWCAICGEPERDDDYAFYADRDKDEPDDALVDALRKRVQQLEKFARYVESQTYDDDLRTRASEALEEQT